MPCVGYRSSHQAFLTQVRSCSSGKAPKDHCLTETYLVATEALPGGLGEDRGEAEKGGVEPPCLHSRTRPCPYTGRFGPVIQKKTRGPCETPPGPSWLTP